MGDRFEDRSGLVLTAGGARGAYQAGVLKRLGQIPKFKQGPSPFQVVAGASAGAINALSLAAGSDDFLGCTANLSQLWSDLKTEKVFRTDAFSMGGTISGWLRDLSMGGIFGGGRAQSLLDASPLKDFLAENLKLDRIQSHIANGHLYAAAVTATNYVSGKSYTFIEGRAGHALWQKSRRVSEPARLSIEHVCASCAIPIVFQPVKISTLAGDFYFGDGGLRLVTPLSPAIRLGAKRVFAIGVRAQKPAEATSNANMVSFESSRAIMRKPPLAQIIGVVLNSIFLDHLDTDVEHLQRINDIVANIPAPVPGESPLKEPMQILRAMIINPTVDLSTIADACSSKMPKLIRYFLEGLGTSKSESADLMSYLLFDQSYTQALVDLGYRDTDARIDEVESFLRDSRAVDSGFSSVVSIKSRV